MSDEPEERDFSEDPCVIGFQLLGALFSTAAYARELLDAVVNRTPAAEIVRNLSVELYEIENHSVGNALGENFVPFMHQCCGYMLECEWDRVELTDQARYYERSLLIREKKAE